MADTAAHLVDRVFPHVAARQWVLSLPFALRYRLAYDSELVTVLGVLGSATGLRRPGAMGRPTRFLNRSSFWRNWWR